MSEDKNKLDEQKNSKSKKFLKKFAYLIIFFFICDVIINIAEKEQEEESSSPSLSSSSNSNAILKAPRLKALQKLGSAEIANINPLELYPIFGFGTDTTDIQRKEKLKQLKNKVVVWTLPVYEIHDKGDGKYSITTSSNNQDGIGCYVLITAKSEIEKHAIFSLKTGSYIKFRGMLTGDMTFRKLEIDPAVLEDTSIYTHDYRDIPHVTVTGYVKGEGDKSNCGNDFNSELNMCVNFSDGQNNYYAGVPKYYINKLNEFAERKMTYKINEVKYRIDGKDYSNKMLKDIQPAS